MANKGDSTEPDVRARLVGCEVIKGGDQVDALYDSTPPLEAKKISVRGSCPSEAGRANP